MGGLVRVQMALSLGLAAGFHINEDDIDTRTFGMQCDIGVSRYEEGFHF